MIETSTVPGWVRAPTLTVISAYLAAIAGAELLTSFVNAEAGVAVHAVLLLVLLNHAMALGPVTYLDPEEGRRIEARRDYIRSWELWKRKVTGK